jgi:dTDP-4-amino-4,6-dideoxygalactose transaminase
MKECEHNGHMFYIKVLNRNIRDRLIKTLKDNGVETVFHYIPLHSSKAGKQFGRFDGTDQYTTKESERLLRLPMYYGLSDEEVIDVVEHIQRFFLID